MRNIFRAFFIEFFFSPPLVECTQLVRPLEGDEIVTAMLFVSQELVVGTSTGRILVVSASAASAHRYSSDCVCVCVCCDSYPDITDWASREKCTHSYSRTAEWTIYTVTLWHCLQS